MVPPNENFSLQSHITTLYLLLKIHKPGNPNHPIAASYFSPTGLVLIYTDIHFQPSFIKDAGHFLEKATAYYKNK